MVKVPPATELSDREREVVYLVIKGFTDAQAGEILHLDTATVNRHLLRI